MGFRGSCGVNRDFCRMVWEFQLASNKPSSACKNLGCTVGFRAGSLLSDVWRLGLKALAWVNIQLQLEYANKFPAFLRVGTCFWAARLIFQMFAHS